MKKAEEWNLEYTTICANDPAVHGQLLPNPQNIAFIKRIQEDALRQAARLAEKVGDSIGQDNPQTGELSDSEASAASGAYMAASRICLEADGVA